MACGETAAPQHEMDVFTSWLMLECLDRNGRKQGIQPSVIE
jgi:hypothetical protein